MQTAFNLDCARDEDRYVNGTRDVLPFKTQLLKWVGNKQRFAHEIISYFPSEFGTYFEPFLGSGAVLATLAPRRAEASDAFTPLMGIWAALQHDPKVVVEWYRERWELAERIGKVLAYGKVRDRYNKRPNPADFLYLSRSCYGGVIRFRRDDGHMSTPCGVHTPIAPSAFARRAFEWNRRIGKTHFYSRDFSYSFSRAAAGDLIYCDPPYVDSQAILYGAQSFSLERLVSEIESAKQRGVLVALSIDGTKKSGAKKVSFQWPKGLFRRELAVNVGRSMLRRFQLEGQSLENEVVTDRLLLTY